MEEKLKLIRWRNERFPPIDLNDNVLHVNELIDEVLELREQVKRLKTYQDIYFKQFPHRKNEKDF